MIIIIILITLSSLIVGLVFGYMMFNDSPANYNYEVTIGSHRYRLKFKTKKTEIWNDYDGIGERKYTVIQLKEEDK